jgi:hypothetical protein
MKTLTCIALAFVTFSACGGIAATTDADAGSDAATSADAATDAPQCSVPDGGSCSSVSDCVIAICADWPCQCFGRAVAKSQLGGCLIEKGGTAPASCVAPRPLCNCPALPRPLAECIGGQCVTVLPDAG